MTRILFTGGWSLWLGITVAVILGAVTWFLYRRETRSRKDKIGWLLPALRTSAVVLLVLMLTGPVLSHRRVVGQLAKILLFVDESASMDLTDASMAPSRKLALAVELGFLDETLLPAHILGAKKELATALAATRGGPSQYTQDTFVQIRDSLAKVLAHLEQVQLEDSLQSPIQKGAINYEYFANVRARRLEDLAREKDFPDRPTSATVLNSFQSRVDWSDNHAARLIGFLYPPVTGEYTFWVTADDVASLYLSNDDSEAGKTLIIESASAPLGEWERDRRQTSRRIQLEAGKRYYIEAVHVERRDSDHVAVGWQLPDGTLDRPISGQYLSPYKTTEKTIHFESQAGAIQQFRIELLGPAEKLVRAKSTEPRELAAEIADLSAACELWQKTLDHAFDRWGQKLMASGVDDISRAIKRVDVMTRRERVETLLLAGKNPVLKELAAQHNVDVIGFGSDQTKPIWHSTVGKMDTSTSFPETLGESAATNSTNLSLGLMMATSLGKKSRAEAVDPEKVDQLAAVVISDGRHNFGTSPLQQARISGSAGIPVYTVGFGTLRAAQDMSVVAVDAPQSVFYKDRIKGRVELKDDMPPGKDFKLHIESDGQMLWDKKLTTSGVGTRQIEFDFAIETLVTKHLSDKDKRLELQSFPLKLKAIVTGLDAADTESKNNESSFRCQAILRRNRVLILDGRPRWEFRYIRNLFTRDEKWEVNAISADLTSNDGEIKRGDKPGHFPASQEYLLTHDLFIIGDFESKLLSEQEMKWIRDAVRNNGSGVILIDGLRGHLRKYGDTPLADLIPVSWTSEEVIQNPKSLRLTEQGVLRLTEQGEDTTALILASGLKRNSEIWASLKPPHWLASVEVLPGGEVLAEAQLEKQKTPILVYRRFGAGKVMFAAFDETWRWRYRVADEYHQRYWNQVGRLIMAQPFDVADRFVSIGCGKLVYSPGQNAEIRAKIRDADGKPVTNVLTVAHLYRNDQKTASINLVVDENDNTYRGKTGSLEAGEYEVRVEPAGYPIEEIVATGTFFVEPPETGELTHLTCDEDMLKQISRTSGGRFVREQEFSTLINELLPLSSGRVVETETALWQSYWWFMGIIALLAIEWILRKRAGLL